MSQISPQQWSNRLAAIQAEIADPDRPDALKLGSYITLGQLYYEARNYALALQPFETALQLNPDSIEALAGQGDSLRHLGRESEAIVAYGLAIARSPRRAELWMNRGRCYEHLERWAEAIADYEAALDLDGSRDRLWQRHANLLYRQERYGGALISYAQALAAQPLKAEEVTSECLFLSSPGPFVQRYRESFAAIDQKLARVETSAPLNDIQLAKLWQLQGERLADYGFWMEAIASFDQALLLRPHRADLHQTRAEALRVIGRLAEAEAGYEQALALFVAQEQLLEETQCREAIAILKEEQAMQPQLKPNLAVWTRLTQPLQQKIQQLGISLRR